jgi:predicted transglutaminase-like cysteine proteinase
MTRLRRAVFLLGIALLLAAAGVGIAPVGAAGDETKPLIPPGKGLFGSHDFRSSLKALPNWTRVMAAAEGQVREMNACNPAQGNCSAAAASWQKILREARGLHGIEQLKTVNSFFNRWPYRLDIDVYGVSEYWATPQEFLKLSGDCEDYSITKYYALRQLGVPIEQMRIVMLTDSIRGIAHAILAVTQGDQTYVLDNVSDLVLPHTKYEHYVPQYSVNERFRWAHVSPAAVRQGLNPIQ